ncbi:MAG: sulfotransferase [Sulfitobacter sp.]
MPVHAPTRAGDLSNTTYANHQPAIARYISDGNFKQALSLLIQVYQIVPIVPELLDDMATCYWNIGDYKTAIKMIKIITKVIGDSPDAWNKLGAMCLSVGDETTAENAFETTLDLNSKDIKALVALNRIGTFKRKSRRAEILKQASRSRNHSSFERAVSYNAVGQIEQASGNYKAAIHNFAKSKAHTPGKYDACAVNAHVASQCRVFRSPDRTKIVPTQKTRFVFIVGMPRSGTTLVESMLSCHTHVETVGETSALQDCLQHCRTQIGKPNGWDWFGDLSDQFALELGAIYRARCARILPDEMPDVVVDKTPLNLFELGFAQRILPDAKFVFMSRHPLDVGLSNFSTNFFAPQPFSKTLDAIGDMTRALYRSAEDYQTKLGASFRWQSYAALVSEPEPNAKALLDHLDIAWDAACLTPENRKGIVATASLTQVRAPINAAALEKWRPFETELQPLIDALGGWAWLDEWQRRDDALRI